MTGKIVAWHIGRLALAVVLLWLDVRFFLFYAFTIVLALGHQINHLRACVRVLSVGTDCKILAVCERLGVTREDISGRYDRIQAELEEADRRSLDADWILTRGR